MSAVTRLNTKPKLRVVRDEAIDIHALLKADCLAKGPEHFAAVHVAGDRNPPVQLPSLTKRRRIGSGTRTERGRIIEL